MLLKKNTVPVLLPPVAWGLLLVVGIVRSQPIFDMAIQCGIEVDETQPFAWFGWLGILEAQDDTAVGDFTAGWHSHCPYTDTTYWSGGTYNHVILMGFDFAAHVNSYAVAHPDIHFTIVDAFMDTMEPNMQMALFTEQHPAFAAGALAGLVTQTKVVGVMAGVPFPALKRFLNGFSRGVKHTCPECQIEGDFVYTFEMSDLGVEFATYLVEERNVDVMFGAAGGAGSGGILHAAQNLGIYVIGVDMDEYGTTFGGGTVSGSDKILSSALKRLDRANHMLVAAELNGQFLGGGAFVFDYSNGGVGLADCHETCDIADGAAIWAQVREVEAAVASLDIDLGLTVNGELVLFPLSPAANTWSRAQVFSGAPPQIRWAASTQIRLPVEMPIDEVMFVFGGDLGNGVLSDQLWTFNYRTHIWTEVSKVLVRGDPGPAARKEHSLHAINGNAKLVVFGGLTAAGRTNDLHIYTPPPMWWPATASWTTLPALASGEPVPSPRNGHIAVPFGAAGGGLLFGGRTEFQVAADLWYLNIVTENGTYTWTDLTDATLSASAAGGPNGRIGHAAVVISGEAYTSVYCFAGANVWGDSLRDLWELRVLPGASARDAPTASWIRLADAPRGRSQHTLNILEVAGETMLVAFGGVDSDGVPLRGADVFYPSSEEWVENYQSFDEPVGRQAHVSAVVDNRLLVSAGSLSTVLETEDGEAIRTAVAADIWIYHIDEEVLALCTSADAYYNVSSCDASTQLRTATFSWYHPELCVDSFIASPVTIECDAVLADSSVGSIVTSLSIVGAVASLLCMATIAKWRKKTVFKMAQVPFLFLFVVGTLLVSLTPLALLGENTDERCIMEPWAFHLSFTFMFAPMFVKIWRVWRILDNPKLKKVKIGNETLFRQFGVFLAVDLFILLAWTILDAPSAVETMVDEPGIGPVSHIECGSDSDAFASMAGFYKAGILGVGVNLAWKTRNFDSSFSEAKHLMFAMYNVMLIALLVLLLTDGMDAAPEARVLLQGLGMVWSAVLSLVLVIGPKVLKRNTLISLSQATSGTGTGKPKSTATGTGNNTVNVGEASLDMNDKEAIKTRINDLQARLQELETGS